MQLPPDQTTTLFLEIGPDFIRKALTIFYERAFADGIIGHFFFGKDRAHLTEQQIAFATGMLGGPRAYQGKPLPTAHHGLKIKPPHFGRRQVLMAQVLEELGLDAELAAGWLKLEDALRPLIIKKGGTNAPPRS